MHWLAPSLVFGLCLVPGGSRLGAHGIYHDALAALDAQLARAGAEASLWHRRACLHLEHQEWAQVLVDLERAERLGFRAGDSDWLRGQALALGGQEAAALAALEVFLQRQPEHVGARLARARLAWHLGQPERALADCRAVLAGEADAEAVLEAVAALVRQGHEAEAADALARHLSRLGDVPFLLSRALELEQRLGRHAEALKRVQALARLAPRPEPWMARGAGLLEQAGRLQEALAAWQSLQEHLLQLPNLQRGLPEVWPRVEESRLAIGRLQRRLSELPPR